MIEESSSILGLEIISSTNIDSEKSFGEEYRTDQATKVWRRLVVAGKAVYESTRDIFTYIGDNVTIR